jgi:hypothetical protein
MPRQRMMVATGGLVKPGYDVKVAATADEAPTIA